MKRDRGSKQFSFSTRGLLILAIGFAIAASTSNALDRSQVNGAKVGMLYREVRGRLLEFGYEGGFPPSRASCTAPQAICKAYPQEVETCAGTGVMPCRFVFKYPRGRTVIVITKGADLVVSALLEE
jgi:hypothetical protein